MGVEIAYRGPVVDLTFLNEKKAPIDSSDINAQIYFNISTPEKKIWDTGGSEAIAIWHYNDELQQWDFCPTFYVPEKLENGKYDRLTCYTSQSGIYMLGKMEFDPFFPLWFKTFDKEMANDLPGAPTLFLTRLGKEQHARAHQEEKTRRAEMRHQAGQEGQGGIVGRERPAPMLAGRMSLGNEVIGMVERHENDDQPAQGIQRKEALALCCFHSGFGSNSVRGAIDFLSKNSECPGMM